MRRKALLSFITLMLFAALVSMAGCDKKDSLESRGYTVIITYDFNGGIADSESKRTLYYKPGQPLLAPGGNPEFKEPVLDRFHSLEGWYPVSTDSDGNLKTDENGNYITEDLPFSFSGAKAEKNITLIAKWKKKPLIELMVDGYGEGTEGGELLYPAEADKRITEKMLETLLPDKSDKTFLGYYHDKECTEAVTFPLTLKDGDEMKIYTKYLDGDVLIVRTKSDMTRIGRYINKTVYLNADIDMAGATFPSLTSFGGKIIGNGHKISNLTVSKNMTGRATDYGLLGELTDGAEINDVIFENVKINVNAAYSSQSLFHIGFLASGVEGNVRLAGVKFEGCSLTVSLPTDDGGKKAINEYGRGTAYEGVLASSGDGSSIAYVCTGSVSYTEN